MNNTEYKTLLETLLQDLESVLKASVYHSNRTHRITVAQRLEAIKAAGYIVTSIQQVYTALQEVEKRLAEEKNNRKEENNDYSIIEMLESDGLIQIVQRQRLRKVFGLPEDEPERGPSNVDGGQDQELQKEKNDCPLENARE